jgi:hypothetical protein
MTAVSNCRGDGGTAANAARKPPDSERDDAAASRVVPLIGDVTRRKSDAWNNRLRGREKGTPRFRWVMRAGVTVRPAPAR